MCAGALGKHSTFKSRPNFESLTTIGTFCHTLNKFNIILSNH